MLPKSDQIKAYYLHLDKYGAKYCSKQNSDFDEQRLNTTTLHVTRERAYSYETHYAHNIASHIWMFTYEDAEKQITNHCMAFCHVTTL